MKPGKPPTETDVHVATALVWRSLLQDQKPTNRITKKDRIWLRYLGVKWK